MPFDEENHSDQIDTGSKVANSGGNTYERVGNNARGVSDVRAGYNVLRLEEYMDVKPELKLSEAYQAAAAGLSAEESARLEKMTEQVMHFIAYRMKGPPDISHIKQRPTDIKASTWLEENYGPWLVCFNKDLVVDQIQQQDIRKHDSNLIQALRNELVELDKTPSEVWFTADPMDVDLDGDNPFLLRIINQLSSKLRHKQKSTPEIEGMAHAV